MTNLDQITYGTLTVMLVVVAVQAFSRTSTYPQAVTDPPPPDAPCVGEPIEVSYPFEGGFLEPWECQVQCDDQVRRYILYSNGKATQCSKLPECLDWGEDNGTTCRPPVESEVSGTGTSVLEE